MSIYQIELQQLFYLLQNQFGCNYKLVFSHHSQLKTIFNHLLASLLFFPSILDLM